jgi:hypothetical protein
MDNARLLYRHSRRVLRSYLDTGDDDTLKAHDVAMFYYIKMFAAEATEQIEAGESMAAILLLTKVFDYEN